MKLHILLSLLTSLLLPIIITSTINIQQPHEPDSYKPSLSEETNEEADSSRKDKVVVYWGQNSVGIKHPNDKTKWEKPLSYYCQDNTVDIIVIAFLNNFPTTSNPLPELNLSYHCTTTFDNSTLLKCFEIGEDIKSCQKNKKKVLLSVGGASGNYGLKDLQYTQTVTKTIWDLFLGGNDIALKGLRPFGPKVKLDGIDLDIEGGSHLYYNNMINLMREHYARDNTKKYSIAVAPQCPFPDYFLKDSLMESFIDLVFIQFYNNFCGVQNFDNKYAFNFHEWDQWASEKSLNRNVKLFLGVPGAATAASNGYLEPQALKRIVEKVKVSKYFGGIMIWDVSQAYGNLLENKGNINFISSIHDVLRSEIPPTTNTVKVESLRSDIVLRKFTNQVLNLINTPCYKESQLLIDSNRNNEAILCLNRFWVPTTINTDRPLNLKALNRTSTTGLKLRMNYRKFDYYDLQLIPIPEYSTEKEFEVLIKIRAIDLIPFKSWKLNFKSYGNKEAEKVVLVDSDRGKLTDYKVNQDYGSNEVAVVGTEAQFIKKLDIKLKFVNFNGRVPNLNQFQFERLQS